MCKWLSKLYILLLLVISVFSTLGCGGGPPPPNEDDHWSGVSDCLDALEDLSDAINEYHNPDAFSGNLPPNAPNPCEEIYRLFVDCEYDPPDPLPQQSPGVVYRGEICLCITVQTVIPMGCLEGWWNNIHLLCSYYCPQLIRYWEVDKSIDERIDHLSMKYINFV